MKRHRNLWESVVSWDNLLGAAEAAARGKRFRGDVSAFDVRREQEVARLREELVSGAWRQGPYRTFQIRDGKPRTISAAPFRDRVVHHALCRVLEPIWERKFIYDLYACRSGKGTHAAADRCQQYCRKAPYVLQLDIRRYFPSMDHGILHDEIARVVADRKVLRLVSIVLSTHGSAGSLWPAGTGLPLGNQTSQFFANVYLDRFDHWVKETLGRRFYLRYVDDFLIFGEGARELYEIREAVQGASQFYGPPPLTLGNGISRARTDYVVVSL